MTPSLLNRLALPSGDAVRYLFTPISGNQKTGPIPVTTSPKTTCSVCCPLKQKGCYADSGALRIHWDKVTRGASGLSWDGLLSAIRSLRKGTLWRWAQAGDLPAREGDLSGDSIDPVKLKQLALANRGNPVVAYSHKPVLDTQSPEAAANRAAIADAKANGFVVNLSANNLSHADKLVALGIAPVVSIVPSTQTVNTVTPAGNRVVICPASVRDNVSCATCGLCARGNREYVIAFPSHGTATKTVDTIAQDSYSYAS